MNHHTDSVRIPLGGEPGAMEGGVILLMLWETQLSQSHSCNSLGSRGFFWIFFLIKRQWFCESVHTGKTVDHWRIPHPVGCFQRCAAGVLCCPHMKACFSFLSSLYVIFIQLFQVVFKVTKRTFMAYGLLAFQYVEILLFSFVFQRGFMLPGASKKRVRIRSLPLPLSLSTLLSPLL